MRRNRTKRNQNNSQNSSDEFLSLNTTEKNSQTLLLLCALVRAKGHFCPLEERIFLGLKTPQNKLSEDASQTCKQNDEQAEKIEHKKSTKI